LKGRAAASIRLRSAVVRQGRVPTIDARQEGEDRPRDLVALLEHHEVALARDDQLALRHEPGVLARRLHRHERISLPVDDQHRAVPAGQDAAERTLVAVVEVPGVGDTQHGVVEPPEVRRQLA
jgi:hypothetical protein